MSHRVEHSLNRQELYSRDNGDNRSKDNNSDKQNKHVIHLTVSTTKSTHEQQEHRGEVETANNTVNVSHTKMPPYRSLQDVYADDTITKFDMTRIFLQNTYIRCKQPLQRIFCTYSEISEQRTKQYMS